MQAVLTFGVFDMMHIGHILLFKHIKEIFGYEDCKLVVAVQDSDVVAKYKAGTIVKYTTEERLFMVSSIKYVDEVIVYKDVETDVMSIPFDVLAKGPDQNHSGFVKAIDWCEANGKKVVTIPRTEGVSSTMLRRAFDD